MADRVRQRSPLAVMVLAMLREAPMHAYRMHELIKERGKDKVVNVAQRNSVYQAIDRLLRAGFIRVQKTSKDEGRPERVTYELTPEGTKVLQSWLEEMLAVPAQEFPEVPVALAFVMLLAPAEVLRLVEERQAALTQQLADARASSGAARKAGLPRLFLLEDEFQQAMLRAELGWFRALAEDLRSGELTWSAEWIRKVAAAMSKP